MKSIEITGFTEPIDAERWTYIQAMSGVEISTEQRRQVNKFGLRHQDNFLWNAILGEEVGEVNTELLKLRFNKDYSTDNLRKELIQVAAVAKSWIENLDLISQQLKFWSKENEKG